MWRRAPVLVVSAGVLTVVLVSLFIAFRPGGIKTETSGVIPRDQTQIAFGKEVYQNNCASCHGAALEGQPDWRKRRTDGRLPAPPHDDSGHTWHHRDVDLFRITKNGIQDIVGPDYETDMPVFKDILTDDEIWAALAFIKSTWSERILQYQREAESRRE